MGIHFKIFNTLRLRKNCLHFTDDIFQCIFLNENIWISPKISLKFVPQVRINNEKYKDLMHLTAVWTLLHCINWIGIIQGFLSIYQYIFENPEVVIIELTHWGQVTHICVGNLTIIGSDNGLSPGRHQAIIWTNAGILLIGLLGTNFSEILIRIQTFSFKKMHSKMSSGK